MRRGQRRNHPLLPAARVAGRPKKPLGGYRHYPPDTAKRVRFIKRAQALGFTLEEVAGLLRLDAASACAETRELAAHKLALTRGEACRAYGHAERIGRARVRMRQRRKTPLPHPSDARNGLARTFHKGQVSGQPGDVLESRSSASGKLVPKSTPHYGHRISPIAVGHVPKFCPETKPRFHFRWRLFNST